MSAIAKPNVRPAATGRTAEKTNAGTGETYRVDGGSATEPKKEKWFEGRDRREIDPIGAAAIDWPTDTARRYQVARDWHIIASHRLVRANVSNAALNMFWHHINLNDDVGTLWPSTELLAAEAVTSEKTITRQLKHYEALGLIGKRRRWIGDRSGGKRQVRIIELTFPADLSPADFQGIAFKRSPWQRYLRGGETPTEGTTGGPFTIDDDLGSERTTGVPSERTMGGPCTVDATQIVEGGGLQPPLIQDPQVNSNRGDQSACDSTREGALSQPPVSAQPRSQWRLKETANLGQHKTGKVVGIGRLFDVQVLLVAVHADGNFIAPLRSDRSVSFADVRARHELTDEEHAALEWEEQL